MVIGITALTMSLIELLTVSKTFENCIFWQTSDYFFLRIYIPSHHHHGHQEQNTYHVVDGVVDGLHNLLLPIHFNVPGSSRAVVDVIYVNRPETFELVV